MEEIQKTKKTVKRDDAEKKLEKMKQNGKIWLRMRKKIPKKQYALPKRADVIKNAQIKKTLKKALTKGIWCGILLRLSQREDKTSKAKAGGP